VSTAGEIQGYALNALIHGPIARPDDLCSIVPATVQYLSSTLYLYRGGRGERQTEQWLFTHFIEKAYSFNRPRNLCMRVCMYMYGTDRISIEEILWC
jgi:hypothetical protein